MLTTMFNTLAGKRIALFGFAFKADTGDTRESPAIDVARHLIGEMAEVAITDPKALENVHSALGDLLDNGRIFMISDPYEAAKDCHALAIMTEWQLYKKLDYEKIYNTMMHPAFIFDGRNLLDYKRLYEKGYNVYSIAKTPLTHFTS
jgi:UDPglucose 6-dehydrogenase